MPSQPATATELDTSSFARCLHSPGRDRKMAKRNITPALCGLAESATRCFAKIVSVTRWKTIMREVEPCRDDQCARGWCDGGKRREREQRVLPFHPWRELPLSDDSRHSVALR